VIWVPISRAELEQEKVSIAADTKAISYGYMPPVSLLPQPAPDWVIVTRKRVERNKQGHLRVELQFFNPTGADQQGAEVQLAFRAMGTMVCFSPTPRPPATQIQVSIEFGKGVAIAYTTEPTFGAESVQRRAIILPESCGYPAMLIVEVGETGIFSPGFNTVRYVFDKGILEVPKNIKLFAGSGLSAFHRDIFLWASLEARIKGNVYPKGVELPLRAAQ